MDKKLIDMKVNAHTLLKLLVKVGKKF